MIVYTPWWVPYAFIGFLIAGAFVFTLQGRMTPAEFLAFGAALGFKAPQPPTMAERQANGNTTDTMNVEAENVAIEEKPKK